MVPALLKLSRLPARPGVSKLRRKVLGRNAYVATTSDLQLLHDSVFIVSDEVDDAALVVWLNRELQRVDPVRPAHLQLVPKTVAPSVDGPSHSHPEILARVEVAKRDSAVEDARLLAAAYPEGHVMRDVCLRLSRHLQRPA